MSLLRNERHSRRVLLKTGPFFLGSFALAACSHRFSNSSLQANEPPAPAPNLLATPACGDDLTPPQTAGPFYTPNSPERTSLLEPGFVGTPIILTGQVLSIRCIPIAGTLLDFWHTNAEGEYDNSGYTFRGHQFTDAEGHYQLETITPGIYSGRTRHIHVRVQSPHQSVLTTQLYFPDEPLNEGDFLYRPELLMSINHSGVGATSPKLNRLQAQFNFVLAGDI